MTRTAVLRWLALALTVVSSGAAAAQRASRPPLTPSDVDAIVTLVRLEDTRQFDEAALTQLVHASHPEVRRRAVIALGRIVDPRGKALLASLRTERDDEIAGAVAFSTGQLKDADAVSWLGQVLSVGPSPPVVAREAARSLGKIRTPEAREALARYLSSQPPSAIAASVVGEALLSMGRFTTPGDLAPIRRWTNSSDVEVRWRATWALYRPRDPSALPDLLRLSRDPSPDVRFWAMRGLAPAPAPAGRGGAAPAAPATMPAQSVDWAPGAARLREAVNDPDRRVRTEALRALGVFDDDASFATILASLDSPDTWLSVSAAEMLGRFTARAAAVVPRLVAASGSTHPRSLRITALTPLIAMAPEAAIELAVSLTRDSSVVARTSAIQALQRLGAPGRAKLDELTAADSTLAAMVPQPGGGGGGGRGQRPPPTPRTDAEYRAIVERWVVPDYNGAPRPRAIWETPRGPIEIEMYPGDAPLGTDYFMQTIASGSIVGTEFGRLVPNFVAQQRTMTGAVTLRDEVNRLGLTRGNLSWASAGLDTGRPGYTLGNTPQPHNEGDFTALGRVVTGLDVVDRLELGDAVTAARVIRR